LGRVKMVVSYDGTNYHGFQRQGELNTIQKALEETIGKLSDSAVRVHGAGRTDAGVHARGQVVAFDTDWTIPIERVPYAMNALLPEDISVLSASEVSPDFHPRYSARSKLYSYTIYTGVHRSPFLRRYTYHFARALNVDSMVEAARLFEGTWDFRAFRSSGSPVRSSTRTVYRSELKASGPLLTLWIEADGFLYNMVRIIVGTLIEVGLGKSGPERVTEAILSGDRRLAGPTVPACGLCLECVYYDLQDHESWRDMDCARLTWQSLRRSSVNGT